MRKHIFVINGSGGVGKDTLCRLAADRWKVQNVSSITPILDVARAAGWDGVKTPAARRFLSDLKTACTAFNDLSLRYCLEQVEAFRQSDNEILFVQIREPEEICRFRSAVHGDCHTLLVRRPALAAYGPLGNDADDCVENFRYDHVFQNDGTLDALPEKAARFFNAIFTG